MAVARQSYAASATWTASQLASQFRSGFIDAGLMTEWYDSFLSGSVENRILEIAYDNTKTYGKVYYWFMFTTSGVFVNTALSWNNVTDQPSGTQYLDYVATTTNATTNHRAILSLNSSTDVALTRFTSSVNVHCTWFVLRNGTSSQAFFVPSTGFGPSAFIDQNKTAFNGMIATSTGIGSGFTTWLGFKHIAGSTRRTYLGASALNGVTYGPYFAYANTLHRYWAIGNSSNQYPQNTPGDADNFYGTILPTAHANTNTSLAASHTPVFTQPTITPYQAPLPSDFGVTSYYASNAMSVGDRLVVASGSEEWEMLSVASNANTDAGRALFLARVV